MPSSADCTGSIAATACGECSSGRTRCPARDGTHGRSPPRRDAPARSARRRPCRAGCSPGSSRRRGAMPIARIRSASFTLASRAGSDPTPRSPAKLSSVPSYSAWRRKPTVTGMSLPSRKSRMAARPASVQHEPPSTASGRRDRASIARNCAQRRRVGMRAAIPQHAARRAPRPCHAASPPTARSPPGRGGRRSRHRPRAPRSPGCASRGRSASPTWRRGENIRR